MNNRQLHQAFTDYLDRHTHVVVVDYYYETQAFACKTVVKLGTLITVPPSS